MSENFEVCSQSNPTHYKGERPLCPECNPKEVIEMPESERSETALTSGGEASDPPAAAQCTCYNLWEEKYNTSQRELAEARGELTEWELLNLWGGTPELVHEFIKGQQVRIHCAQDLEKQLCEAWQLVNAMAGQEPWERAEKWLDDNRQFAPEGAQRV